MVPTRGAAPVLGTNPIAFAAPARRNRPFVLDMATTTVAANKVKVYDLNRKPLPEGWVVDERGPPVTDAALAMDYLFKRPEGGLTPLGGTPEMGSHKGYGLAMMVQILGATLTGGSFSPLRNRDADGPDEPDNIGHFFLAIDPKAFRPARRVRGRPGRGDRRAARDAAQRCGRAGAGGRRAGGASRARGGCGRASRSRPRWTATSATSAAAAAPSTCSRTRDKASGIRRFVTATDSVAAPRSKAAPETLRASTRTVLLLHVKASSSMKRVEEASDASARSPCRAPGTVTSTRCTAPAASFGRSSVVSTANSRWPTGRVGCRRAGPAPPPAGRRGGAPPARPRAGPAPPRARP